MTDTILRLTWSQTKDYFDVVPENDEFARWYVQQCKDHGNLFLPEISVAIDDLTAQIKNNLQEVNQFLTKINFTKIPVFEDLYDQNNLNATHKNWIAVIRKEPRIDQLFYNISPDLFKKFHDINLLIHKVEKKFNYKLLGDPNWRVDNIFQHVQPTLGVFNVGINFTDWGKSSWHKFLDGIEDPNDFELSNWQTIGSDININLCNPHVTAMSPDYIDYCRKNEIDTVVDIWPLGNLVDHVHTIPKVRCLMNHNTQIPDNHLEFSIIE
jgi:hypothetical protein